ncbi:hypothetical protein F5Y14DRAFT_448553 [Nemania sp. NC0429]|nr:hypothetical protein F5Y14DRAFT_448553 [Nemania sp. NC0429]
MGTDPNFLRTRSNKLLIFIDYQSWSPPIIYPEDLLYQYRNMSARTRIEERYLIKSALDRLLWSLFGSNFTHQGKYYEITAARELTDGEIESVLSTR